MTNVSFTFRALVILAIGLALIAFNKTVRYRELSKEEIGYNLWKDVQEETNLTKGRYQMHDAQVAGVSFPLVLDTKTGKIWQWTQTGFVGVTVQGLAYGNKDLSDFQQQLGQMTVEGVTPDKAKQVKNNMLAEFSYVSDSDKMTRAIIYQLEKKKEVIR